MALPKLNAYKHRNNSLLKACEDLNFCCQFVEIEGKQQIELKQEHQYYSQIQRQMAVGCGTWMYISNEVHEYTSMLTFGMTSCYQS